MREQMSKILEAIDTDDSGTITAAEFGLCLKYFGMSLNKVGVELLYSSIIKLTGGKMTHENLLIFFFPRNTNQSCLSNGFNLIQYKGGGNYLDEENDDSDENIGFDNFDENRDFDENRSFDD